jgi:TusA-related sulfurtransferase
MSDNNEKFDDVLDCVGLYCPVPIFETRKKMDILEKGQVLKMMADDPGSKPDMESWAKSTGNELLKVDEEDGIFTFYIKKKE